MRIILATIVLIVLNSCGSSQYSAPKVTWQSILNSIDSKRLCYINLRNEKLPPAYENNALFKRYAKTEAKSRNLDCRSILSEEDYKIAEQKKMQLEREARVRKQKEEAHLAKLEDEYGFSCEWMSWLTRGTPEFNKCLKDKYYEDKYKKITNSSTSSSNSSSISDPIIARYQSECIEMGFKKKTDKMADCILRQKDIETRKVAAKKLYDEEVRKNKAAEELAAKKRKSEKMRAAGELLTGISNSLLGSGSSNSYSSSSSSSQIKTACMFKDEVQKYGSLTKLCLYDCTGSVHSETINVVQMCPLISYK